MCLDRAREEARAAEAAYSRGEVVGPLAGVPFVVKDLFDTEGVRTTYGSPMFADHVPDRDAVAVRSVRDAGAILIGKAQTHEFAWGITSVNFLMGAPTTRGLRSECPEVRAAARPWRWPPEWRRSRSAATPAARSACRRTSAGPSG